MRKYLLVFSIVFPLLILPFSYLHCTSHPYDFGYYWSHAHGSHPFSMAEGYWVYSEHSAWIFAWMQGMSYINSWIIFYSIISISTSILLWKCFCYGPYSEIRFLVGCIFTIAAYPLLKCGNIQPLLALLSLNPVGCLLAGSIKPYWSLLLFLHAGKYCIRRSI